MDQMPKLPKSLLDTHPLQGWTDPIWPGSVCMLHRNLSTHLFPKKLGEKEAEDVLQDIQKYLCPQLKDPFLIQNHMISPLEKEYLFEHFILQQAYENLSAGKGFIVDETGKFLALLNIEDHLHMHLFSTCPSLQASVDSILEKEEEISKKLSFAVSPRFGFLTEDPFLSGTGLSIQSFLHLPVLLALNKLESAVQEVNDAVSLTSLGQNGETWADIILLENNYASGTTEQEISLSLEKAAYHLREQELNARKNLDATEIEYLKTKASKALGTLSFAYRLDIKEALSHLSTLYLAHQLGWIQAEDFDFFSLFFSLRRAHLFLQKEELSTQDPQDTRACVLKEYASKLTPSF